jgi:hypothetical protein
MAGASITINVRDTATPVVSGVLEGLAPEKINPVLGRAAVNLTRNHLFRLNGERANRLGGKRTNFYAQAARGTSFELTPTGFVQSVNQVGIGQRYFGGTITPKGGKKYLTIPMRAEAYGKRAGEFNNLRFAMVPGIGPALVETEATSLRKTRSKKGGVSTTRFKSAGEVGGGVMFRLVRKVTQQADPSVMPAREDYVGAMNAAGRSYVSRLLERRAQQ